MSVATRPRIRIGLPPSRVVARLGGALAAPGARGFSWQFLVLVAAVAALLMVWRDGRHPSLGLHDFYPLYYGAKAWLQTGNAYDLPAVAPLADREHGIFLTGNGYPLPAVLLTLPFAALSPHAAAVLWIGLTAAGILLALRLYGASPWLFLYWPLLESIRLEQYTSLVLGGQIVALWAYRERRPWLLGLSCALVLTKPTQGAYFVLALLLLTRQRWQPCAVIAGVWGLSLLVDYNWALEWLASLRQYNTVATHDYYRQLAFFAIPLLLLRNYVGGAITASFTLFRFPYLAPYMAGMIPFAVLDDRRAIWLVPLSYLWWPVAALVGHAWAVALVFVLPMVLLAARIAYERHRERVAGGGGGVDGPHPAAAAAPLS